MTKDQFKERIHKFILQEIQFRGECDVKRIDEIVEDDLKWMNYIQEVKAILKEYDSTCRICERENRCSKTWKLIRELTGGNYEVESQQSIGNLSGTKRISITNQE